MGYDLANRVWQPVDAGLYLRYLADDIYNHNGILTNSRTIGMNDNDITFSNHAGYSNRFGETGTFASSVDFNVWLSADGTSPGGTVDLYSAGVVRTNHGRWYNDGYQSYGSWDDGSAVGFNDHAEYRQILLGFFMGIVTGKH